jgi:hypothetical protein
LFQTRIGVLISSGAFQSSKDVDDELDAKKIGKINELLFDMKYYLENNGDYVDPRGVIYPGKESYKDTQKLSDLRELAMNLDLHMKLRTNQCGNDYQEFMGKLTNISAYEIKAKAACLDNNHISASPKSDNLTTLMSQVNSIAQEVYDGEKTLSDEFKAFPWWTIEGVQEAKEIGMDDEVQRLQGLSKTIAKIMNRTETPETKRMVKQQLERMSMYDRIHREAFLESQKESVKTFITNDLLYRKRKIPTKGTKEYNDYKSGVVKSFCPKISKSCSVRVSNIFNVASKKLSNKIWDGNLNLMGGNCKGDQRAFNFARKRCEVEMNKAAEAALKNVDKNIEVLGGFKTPKDLKKQWNKFADDLKPQIKQLNKQLKVQAEVIDKKDTGRSKSFGRGRDKVTHSIYEYRTKPKLDGVNDEQLRKIEKQFYDEMLDKPHGRFLASDKLEVNPFVSKQEGIVSPGEFVFNEPKKIKDESKVAEAINDMQSGILKMGSHLALDFYQLYDKSMNADWMNNPDEGLLLQLIREENLADLGLLKDLDHQSFYRALAKRPEYAVYHCQVLKDIDTKIDRDERERRYAHYVAMGAGFATLGLGLAASPLLIARGFMVAGQAAASSAAIIGVGAMPVGILAGELSAKEYNNQTKQLEALYGSYYAGKNDLSYIDFSKMESKHRQILNEMLFDVALTPLEALAIADLFQGVAKGAKSASKYLGKIDDMGDVAKRVAMKADDSTIPELISKLSGKFPIEDTNKIEANLKLYVAIFEEADPAVAKKLLSKLDDPKYAKNFIENISKTCMVKEALSPACLKFFKNYVNSAGNPAFIADLNKLHKSEQVLGLRQNAMKRQKTRDAIDEIAGNKFHPEQAPYQKMKETIESIEDWKDGSMLQEKMVEFADLYLTLNKNNPSKYPISMVSKEFDNLAEELKAIGKGRGKAEFEKNVGLLMAKIEDCLKTGETGCVSQSKTIRNIAQKSGVGTPADVADMAKKLDISIEDYWKLKDAAFEEHADIIATLNKNLKGDDLVEAQHIVTDIAVIYKKKYGKNSNANQVRT